MSSPLIWICISLKLMTMWADQEVDSSCLDIRFIKAFNYIRSDTSTVKDIISAENTEIGFRNDPIKDFDFVVSDSIVHISAEFIFNFEIIKSKYGISYDPGTPYKIYKTELKEKTGLDPDSLFREWTLFENEQIEKYKGYTLPAINQLNESYDEDKAHIVVHFSKPRSDIMLDNYLTASAFVVAENEDYRDYEIRLGRYTIATYLFKFDKNDNLLHTYSKILYQ